MSSAISLAYFFLQIVMTGCMYSLCRSVSIFDKQCGGNYLINVVHESIINKLLVAEISNKILYV